MAKKKRKNIQSYVIASSILAILIILGLFNLFRYTGFVTNVSTSANITVGGSAPTIFDISFGPQTIDVIDGGFFQVNFSFLADDQNGIGEFSNSTANATLTLMDGSVFDGISLNDTLCDADIGINSTVQNYSCSINIRYFDQPNTNGWNVNASIYDTSGLSGISNNIGSDVIFSINSLLAVNMTPTALTWATVTVGQTNVLSDNDPLIIGNTGNANITTGNVNVTAIDLRGETVLTEFIDAANFTTNVLDACDTGTTLANATSTLIASSTLPTGLNLGEVATEEQLFLCLETVPPDPVVTAQSFSTGGVGNWDVGVS